MKLLIINITDVRASLDTSELYYAVNKFNISYILKIKEQNSKLRDQVEVEQLYTGDQIIKEM